MSTTTVGLCAELYWNSKHVGKNIRHVLTGFIEISVQSVLPGTKSFSLERMDKILAKFDH
jgi:hypothetical protein